MLKCFVPAAVICLSICALNAQEITIVEEESSVVVEQTLGDVVVEEDTSVVVDSVSQAKKSDSSSQKTESSDKLISGEDDLLISGDEEESILSTETRETSEPLQQKNVSSDSTGSSRLSEKENQENTTDVKHSTEKITRPIKTPSALPGKTVSGKKAAEDEKDDEAEIVVEPVVEDARSVNFAKNATEYRSPKKAMLLSMLVPGLGQAYVKKYVKSAVFGVAEAAIIGIAVNYHMKGDDQKDRARNFADDHYNHDKFRTFFDNLGSYLSANYADSTGSYGDILNLEFDSLVVHSNKKDDDYYHAVERNSFVQGWDDVEPQFDQGGYVREDESYDYTYEHYNSDTTWKVNRKDRENGKVLQSGIYGYSVNQNQYKDMVSEANGHYRVTNNMLFLLLANHLVSAVDALISAKAYNDALLERESFWQRIHLDQQWAFSGSDMKTRLGVNIRF
ncbi:MAG: DUF5683 domain-containing protein [Fibrobacterota bacterium]